MTIQASAVCLHHDPVITLGFIADDGIVAHGHQIVTGSATFRTIGQHFAYRARVRVRVVTGRTVGVLIQFVVNGVYAIFLCFVAHRADFTLTARLQHRVFVGVHIVTAYTGEIVGHVQGILPVLGNIALVTSQALLVLLCNSSAPAWAVADIGCRDSGPGHVIITGTVAGFAASLGIAVLTAQHGVYR